jgi:mycofactocin system glycosyltransferase
VPPGWRLRRAQAVRHECGGEVLLGGSPLRLIRLSPSGARLVAGWWAGRPVGDDSQERLLARRLLDAGIADPQPPPLQLVSEDAPGVTVVVPVYGDAERLRHCLRALGRRSPVVVVDDGSPDGAAIAAVAKCFDARYVRHGHNRGPAAARNTGLRHSCSPFVAFLDCDCLASPDFPYGLLAHMADPAVALVAPRIGSAAAGRGPLAAYERSRSPLDMGPDSARARPYGRVAFVPSAALLARRTALGTGFDEDLRVGEDVDLVWRLHDAGWQTRLEPRFTVTHADRLRPADWYRRRVTYNASVPPLARLHPGRLPVLFLSWPAALTWSVALAVHPAALVALLAGRAVRLRRALVGRVAGASSVAVRVSVTGVAREGAELTRAMLGPWSLCLVGALAVDRRRPARRGHGFSRRTRGVARRLGVLAFATLAADWVRDRPALDPLTYGALRALDESARGAGIWLGCLRERDVRSLLAARPPRSGRLGDDR